MIISPIDKTKYVQYLLQILKIHIHMGKTCVRFSKKIHHWFLIERSLVRSRIAASLRTPLNLDFNYSVARDIPNSVVTPCHIYHYTQRALHYASAACHFVAGYSEFCRLFSPFCAIETRNTLDATKQKTGLRDAFADQLAANRIPKARNSQRNALEIV